MISYHEHNEANRAEELANFLKIGKSIAILSDAGTPGISNRSLPYRPKSTPKLVQKLQQFPVLSLL